MKVCGVDLNSNDANLCLLSLEDELFQLPDFRSRRLTLPGSHSASDLRYFQQTFAKLMQDYQVDKVVIRQRPMKGKFAGGAVGFKLEAAIELIADLDVIILSPTDIKESIKRNPIAVPFTETGLKAYQETAFNTAYAYLMQAKYADRSPLAGGGSGPALPPALSVFQLTPVHPVLTFGQHRLQQTRQHYALLVALDLHHHKMFLALDRRYCGPLAVQQLGWVDSVHVFS